MQTLPKLYKRDNTGATRVWWAELDGQRYRLCSGQLGGATTKTEWTTCDAKNVGRSNEVNPKAQAAAEVDSHYNRKLKRGYTRDAARVDKAKESLIAPMLAHKFEDYKEKITFPLWCQPKLDGIRCIIRPDGAWSRKGEKITTVPHITDMMVMLAIRLQVSFDGELYNHDYHDNFNHIQSLVSKKDISSARKRDIERLVQYHVYDLVDNTMRFPERWDVLKHIIRREISDDCESIVLVHTRRCDDIDMLDSAYMQYLENNYEGQMIRTDDLYQRKRSKHLLKRKEFQDAEFQIIGMVEGKGNRSGQVGAIVFETANGKQFSAALTGTDAYRKRIWREHQEHPFDGVDATVKFQNYTPDGIPRFPVVKCIDEGK